MAIDTREKRNSALSLLVPVFVPGIAPSAMNQAQRQAAALVYSGILAGGAAAVTIPKHRGFTINVARMLRG